MFTLTSQFCAFVALYHEFILLPLSTFDEEKDREEK